MHLNEMIKRAATHRDKIAGSRLREMIKVLPRPGQGQGFEVQFGGRPLTQVFGNTSPAGFSVTGTQPIHEALRGMGLGRKIYGEIARQSPNRTIMSDKIVSPEAQRVYRSMAKDPHYSVIKNPESTVSEGGTWWQPQGGDLQSQWHHSVGYPSVFNAQLRGTFPSPVPPVPATPPATTLRSGLTTMWNRFSGATQNTVKNIKGLFGNS